MEGGGREGEGGEGKRHAIAEFIGERRDPEAASRKVVEDQSANKLAHLSSRVPETALSRD